MSRIQLRGHLAAFSVGVVIWVTPSGQSQPLYTNEAIPVPRGLDDRLATPQGQRSWNLQTTVLNDLNGDGLPELLVSYLLGREIRLGMSERPGVWAEPTVLATLPEDFRFIDALVRDVNGDGFEDLVYCAESPPQFVTGQPDAVLAFGAVLISPDGQATTPPPRQVPNPDSFYTLIQSAFSWSPADGDFVSLGDVTGDGHLDLVVPGHDLFVMPGDGAGGFGEPEVVLEDRPGFRAWAAVPVDIDNDGRSELLTIDDEAATILGLGENGWADLASLSLEGVFAHADSSILSISFTDHSTVTDNVRAYVSADARSSAHAPLFAIDLLADLSLALGPVFDQPSSTRHAYSKIGDVAGGDAPDLVRSDGTVFVDLGRSHFGERRVFDRWHGTSEQYPSGAIITTNRHVEVRDMNADGLGDIVLADFEAVRVTLAHRDIHGERGFPTPRFVQGTTGSESSRIRPILNDVGDLNGDGLLDVVTDIRGQLLVTHIQTADGHFESVRLPDFSVNTHYRTTIADLDEDGRADLISVPPLNSAPETSVAFRYFDADGAVEHVETIDVGLEFFEAETGDVDGDGKAEVVVHGFTTNGQSHVQHFSILEPLGDRSFSVLYREDRIEGLGNGLAVGDLNGDGFDDVVLCLHGPEAFFSVSLSRGDGSFDPPVAGGGIAADSGFTRDIALGDLDQDGDLDLAVAGSFEIGGSYRHVLVFENDGNGIFFAAAMLPTDNENLNSFGYLSTSIVLADADGDSDLDLFVNTVSGRVSLRRNDGLFNFRLHAHLGLSGVLRARDEILQFRLADFTGDNRPEVVVPDISVMTRTDIPQSVLDPASGFRIIENIATPRTLCAADYAEPAGLLNTADITAFVSAFIDQQPEADLAARFGTLDLADLVAFIEAFTAGCE